MAETRRYGLPQAASDLSGGAVAVVDFESARAVADAVLYEGYLLYPYCRSSGKNRVCWQFGVLAPRGWLEQTGAIGTSVAGSADAWHQQTECLLQALDPATVQVRLRFLYLQHRCVEVRGADGNFQQCDGLDVGDQWYLTFDEAVPREFDIAVQVGELQGDGHPTTIEVPGGEDVETPRRAGTPDPQLAVGRNCAHRHRRAVPAAQTSADRRKHCGFDRHDAWRADALTRSLVATHSLLGLRGGSFVTSVPAAAELFDQPTAWRQGR